MEILNKGTLLKLEELLNEDSCLAGNPFLNAVILETETQEMVHSKEEKQDCMKRNKFFERNNYNQFYKHRLLPVKEMKSESEEEVNDQLERLVRFHF